MQRRGLMLVLSSPSGAGKTTLSRRLLQSDPAIAMSVSATTRKPRPNEIDGQDYHFIDDAEFERRAKAGGFLDTGCDLRNPNFAAMAQAAGIKGIRVEKPHELHSAVREALEHDGPVLVDVVSARQELVMPPVTTFGEAHKFGLFMMKAVLDGRASQLIDLAKVNLMR